MNPCLQVVDIPFVKGLPSAILTTYIHSQTLPTLPAALSGLLPQNAESCRLYVERGMENSSDFMRHISDVVTPDFASAYLNPEASGSLIEALSQCCDPSPSRWWQFDTYTVHFSDNDKVDFEALVLRYKITTKIVRSCDGYILVFVTWKMVGVTKAHLHENRFEYYGRSYDKLNDSRLHNTLKELTYIEVDHYLPEYVQMLLHLDSFYYNALNGSTTTEVRLQILLLQIGHTAISRQLATVEALQRPYSAFLRGLTEVYGKIIDITFMCQMAGLKSACSDVERSVRELAAVTNALLQPLPIDLPDSPELQRLQTDVRWTYGTLQRAVASISERFSVCEKTIETDRVMRESESLHYISVLASIFLPLTLSSSILSMQSRLMDLHDLFLISLVSWW